MKLLWLFLAFALILLGLATLWLPIPTGVPLLAAGTITLIAADRRAARLLRRQRKALPRLNSLFVWLEDRSPVRLGRILRRTRPASGTGARPLSVTLLNSPGRSPHP